MHTPNENQIPNIVSASMQMPGHPGESHERSKRPDLKAAKKQYASEADVRQMLDGLPTRMGPYLDTLEDNVRKCEVDVELVRRHQQELRSDEARIHYMAAEDTLAARHEESLANRQRVYDLLADVDATMHEVLANATGQGSPKAQAKAIASKDRQVDGLSQQALARHAAGMFPPPRGGVKARKRG